MLTMRGLAEIPAVRTESHTIPNRTLVKNDDIQGQIVEHCTGVTLCSGAGGAFPKLDVAGKVCT